MKSFVLNFKEIDKSMIADVGGKGVNLGELTKIDNINIPDGFCITTSAYKKTIENNIELNNLFDDLSKLKSVDREKISLVSNDIRNVIENIIIDKEIEKEIIIELANYDKEQSFAVRSSATAEDLPTASFAGQQDTYLNIKGNEEVIAHVIKCWASLFTDRAVTYRIKNGFDHRKVFISVLVQKMVMSESSGIMFTADPMTSDRKTLSIDAGFGLGEALVSGIVNPDIYKVQDENISKKNIGIKNIEIKPMLGGKT
ncbi:MAG: PEP/pyruvate-binding domain-containing protein, partial [Tissierellia bacterium]|nr:PEP/pyruvate-binding domain-containing protein [Tissierellia bacterium]